MQKFVGAFHLSRRVSDENKSMFYFHPVFFFKITDPFDGRSFVMCSHDPFFGTNKNRMLKNGSCERALKSSLKSTVFSILPWPTMLLKSVQSALSDLLTTSATHGTFCRPSTKRGLILIGLELNTNAREPFEHCSSYSLNLSIDQHVC